MGAVVLDKVLSRLEIHVEPFSLCLLSAFGLPPMNLLHRIRMQRAALLLRQRDELSVDAVAQRVGFSSRSHFSRAFKKHYGVSPIAHRMQ